MTRSTHIALLAHGIAHAARGTARTALHAAQHGPGRGHAGGTATPSALRGAGAASCSSSRAVTCRAVPSCAAAQHDEWGAQHASEFSLTGRVLLNLWRVLRGELKLSSYSFESCAAAVLGLRVPRVREQQLALW